MTEIAFLGLGAMGSRMARRLVEAGHAVTVWNRSPVAAEPLLALGAGLAASPRAAAERAEIVISMVADDAAARTVWLDPANGASLGLGAGKLAIESSTVSPGWVLELGARIKELAADFVEAPVSGSRPQAESGKLIFMLGGEAEAVERARVALGNAGSAFPHVGGLGFASRLKLAVNSMLATQVALWAELAAMLTLSGFEEKALVETLAAFPVTSPPALNYARLMAQGVAAPMFTVDLMNKDLGYALSAGTAVGVDLEVVAAVKRVFEASRAAGDGEKNISAIRNLHC